MNNYNRIYYDNLNYIINNENEVGENEVGENEVSEHEIAPDYKCVICFENIINLEEKVLNKLCVCTDSLVCNKCLIYMENNNIKKCPVCRANLNIYTINRYIFNIKNVILYYINFIIFILFNVIIYNMALNYKYYNNKTDYPIINNYNNDDIFIIDSDKNLDIRESFSNYEVCKNNIMYKKNIYFLLTNLFVNILFPFVLGIHNSISLYRYHNDEESSKINRGIMYVFTCLNMLNISVICVINKKIDHLQLLLMLNALLYGILFFCSIILYFFTYLDLFHKQMKNENMINTIQYNIYNQLVLNTIQTTNV